MRGIGGSVNIGSVSFPLVGQPCSCVCVDGYRITLTHRRRTTGGCRCSYGRHTEVKSNRRIASIGGRYSPSIGARCIFEFGSESDGITLTNGSGVRRGKGGQNRSCQVIGSGDVSDGHRIG